MLIGVLVVGGGLWVWSHLPKAVQLELVRFRVMPPPRTPIEETDAKPRPMRVIFQKSVAPIAAVGKEVSGVSIDPVIEGLWTWVNDRQLEFQPRGDWPIGTEYSVQIDPKVAVAPHKRLAKTQFKFKTAVFEGSFKSSEFYQDPADPSTDWILNEDMTFAHKVYVVDFR